MNCKSDGFKLLSCIDQGDEKVIKVTVLLCPEMLLAVKTDSILNSPPPGQNGRHFADDIFRCIFVNEKFCILIKISLKFVSEGPIDNNPALV